MAKLIKGKNDLATVNPQLAKEWNYQRNGDLTPSDVFPSAARKVWWVCPNGHEYQATINHRSQKNGTNCPICNSGRQTSFREQAIFFYVKKLYRNAINRYKPEGFGKFELDIYIPDIRTAIEYDGAPWHKESKYDREKRKYLLCKNNGIKLIRVKEKMPEQYWLELADTMVSYGDFETEEGFTNIIHDVLKQVCFSRPYYVAPVDVNLSRDRFEIMRYAAEIKESFASEYPIQAKEWHPIKNETLKPTMFRPNSHFKAWWVCSKCGVEYEKIISDRAKGKGCPKCSIEQQKATLRKNIVAKNGGITNPLLLKEWDYEKNGDLKPEHFPRTSTAKVYWKCSVCGHSWRAKISNREFGNGCPKCAYVKLIPGYNDLATVHPELLDEWDYERNKGLDPRNIHSGSKKPVYWICSKCGHKWQAPVQRRTNGAGCRKCADKANPELIRKAILKKNGSLAEICPELLKEYSPNNPLSPDMIASSSHENVEWICSTCGYVWNAAPYTRVKGHGCKRCGIIKSVNSRKANNKH